MPTKRFGAFEGVFTPTFLSILGVIMYLRLGWVVGNVGLYNALLIITIANLITIFTCLSVSSIATNMRIGTGGAYSIISKSLGLEVGGAIGIPLYLSQAISVAFYITGFTECWVSIFPSHEFIFISLITWLALLIISYTSAKFAFRLQYAIIAIVVFSLISFFLGKSTLAEPSFFREGLGSLDFWKVFAVFFPAVTGILAGLSMSGELKRPERDIPLGMLLAVGVTFIIYLTLAFKFAHAASDQALVNNTAIIIDLGRWKSIIVAGIMGAAISSALSMFVASPRTLLALGKYRTIPLASQFAHVTKRNEPTTAILFTACLSLLAIVFGTLNKIAGLLTMFFLITYGMLNISVFIEQIIGIASFRPAFRVNVVFPLLGGLGCLFAMFLINPLFSLVAILIIILIYLILIQQEVRENWPDVRKGLFIFIAEQAMKISRGLPYHPKIWKPNLLIPVSQPQEWLNLTDFIKAITFPSGRVNFFKVAKEAGYSQTQIDKRKQIDEDFSLLTAPLKEEGILASSVVVGSTDFLEGATIVTQTMEASIFPPNILLVKLGLTPQQDPDLKKLIERMKALDLGVLLLALHPTNEFGQKQMINVWLREKSPNVHLAVLIALKIQKNWDAKIRLIQAVDKEEDRSRAWGYLYRIKKLMRIPKETETLVLVGNFEEILTSAPGADMNMFGMSEEVNIAQKRKIANKLDTSLLFLRDSKHESAVA